MRRGHYFRVSSTYTRSPTIASRGRRWRTSVCSGSYAAQTTWEMFCLCRQCGISSKNSRAPSEKENSAAKEHSGRVCSRKAQACAGTITGPLLLCNWFRPSSPILPRRWEYKSSSSTIVSPLWTPTLAKTSIRSCSRLSVISLRNWLLFERSVTLQSNPVRNPPCSCL